MILYCVVICKATRSPYVAYKGVYLDCIEYADTVWSSIRTLDKGNLVSSGIGLRIINERDEQKLSNVPVGHIQNFGIDVVLDYGGL